MVRPDDVAPIVGRTMELVVRPIAMLLGVSALIVPAAAQILKVDDGVPPAARWVASLVMWALVAWVLRTPLTEPETAARNQVRLEAFPIVLACVASGLQLLSPTAVMSFLMLLAGLLAAAISRRWTALTLAAAMAVVHVVATARAEEPDWLTTVGFLTSLALAMWMASTVARTHKEVIREQLEGLVLERQRSTQLQLLAEAAKDLQTLEPGRVEATVTSTSALLGWDLGRLRLRAQGADVARDDDDLLLDDVANDVNRSGGTIFRSGPAAGGALQTVVGVPVASSPGTGNRLGTLLVARRASAANQHDVRLIELLAQQASCAMELAERFDSNAHTLAEAERLVRLKDDFLATVSHELRTPLHVVLGMAETLDVRWTGINDDDRHDMIGRVHRHAAGLASMIETLLDFSQLEAGDLPVEPQLVSLLQIAKTVIEHASELSSDHVIRLDHVDEPGDGPAWADERLAERIVDSLVTNAMRHTPAGTVVVVRVSDTGGCTRLEVSDDGPGLVPDDVPRLTERFFRSGDPLQRSSRGAGLGLAFCDEVLRLHGARLRIDNRPGEGVTFSFELPRRAHVSA